MLLPGNKLDRPFLYRTLNRLEREGKVTVRLDSSQSGPVKKYYTLTDAGWNKLNHFEQDIRFRVENLNTFLKKIEQLKKDK